MIFFIISHLPNFHISLSKFSYHCRWVFACLIEWDHLTTPKRWQKCAVLQRFQTGPTYEHWRFGGRLDGLLWVDWFLSYEIYLCEGWRDGLVCVMYRDPYGSTMHYLDVTQDCHGEVFHIISKYGGRCVYFHLRRKIVISIFEDVGRCDLWVICEESVLRHV